MGIVSLSPNRRTRDLVTVPADPAPPPVPVEFVGAAVTYANNATLPTDRPSGTSPGDYLVLAVRSNLALSAPSGWTLISDASIGGDSRDVYGRVADLTATDEPTFPSSGHYGGSTMTAWSGVNATPTAGVATATTHAASSSAKAAPTVTATADGVVLNIEIRSLGGVCSATTGGTVATGTNVHALYLCSTVVYDDAADTATVGGATFTPTTSSDSATHTIVLANA